MSKRVLFQEIFDGPGSVFGKIFGPRQHKLRQRRRAPALPLIRINLTDLNMMHMNGGTELTFTTPGCTITVQHKPQVKA